MPPCNDFVAGRIFLLLSGELLPTSHCCFSVFAAGLRSSRQAKQPVAAQFAFAHLAALSTFGGCRPSLLYNIMYRHLLPNVAFSLLPDAFLFCLLPANYRLPGTNYGLVAANDSLAPANHKMIRCEGGRDAPCARICWRF